MSGGLLGFVPPAALPPSGVSPAGETSMYTALGLVSYTAGGEQAFGGEEGRGGSVANFGAPVLVIAGDLRGRP